MARYLSTFRIGGCRQIRGKLLLTLLSVIATMAACETGYRSYLRLRILYAAEHEVPDRRLKYRAYSRPTDRFDREFGYAYVPEANALFASVDRGYPAACRNVVINELGNTDRIDRPYEEADFRVLIFGDSFSANVHHGGLTWPDLFESDLDASLPSDVVVMNFARGGYGVLQMFDLAAAKAEELRPDMVIIAFISGDLERNRFWRSVRRIGGRTRWLVAAEPLEAPEPLWQSIDVALVHPGITAEWCQAMLGNNNRDDPILRELNGEYRRLRRALRQPLVFTSLRTSFLANRILHGDPFHGFDKPRKLPYFDQHDYAADPRFVESVRRLKRSGASLHLVQLPTYTEFLKGSYSRTIRRISLLASLERLTGERVIRILEHVSTPPKPRLDELFLPRYDGHPDVSGLQFYADAVRRALESRGASFEPTPRVSP
jgi:hypothetical protein